MRRAQNKQSLSAFQDKRTLEHTRAVAGLDRDLCVSAPTGSGKTLAYAIPIVQALCRQTKLSQLRSLVIVPTGDLAAQVGNVFKPLCRAVGLKVSIAQGSGIKSLYHNDAFGEQNAFRHHPAVKQKFITSLTVQTTVTDLTSNDTTDIRDVDILVTPQVDLSHWFVDLLDCFSIRSNFW